MDQDRARLLQEQIQKVGGEIKSEEASISPPISALSSVLMEGISAGKTYRKSVVLLETEKFVDLTRNGGKQKETERSDQDFGELY